MLLPIIAYMEKFANRQSNILPQDSYITFAVEVHSTSTKTQVLLNHVRTTALADDLGIVSTGARFHATDGRKDVPIEAQLANYERAILKTSGRGEDLHRLMREFRNKLAV